METMRSLIRNETVRKTRKKKFFLRVNYGFLFTASPLRLGCIKMPSKNCEYIEIEQDGGRRVRVRWKLSAFLAPVDSCVLLSLFVVIYAIIHPLVVVVIWELNCTQWGNERQRREVFLYVILLSCLQQQQQPPPLGWRRTKKSIECWT